MLHKGLGQALGPTYYHRCVPAPLRRFAWRYCSDDGREARRIAQERLRVLQELHDEQAAEEQEAQSESARAGEQDDESESAALGGGRCSSI